MRHVNFCVGVLAVFSLGCGGSSGKEKAEECTVTNETLDGTQWVMHEAMGKAKYRENRMARMEFFSEEETQKVRYTVKSPGDVYTYSCDAKYIDGNPTQGVKEWFCKEEAHLRDWCQALEVHKEGSCTPAKLKELGAEGTAKEFEDAIKLAGETTAKYRDKPEWRQFKLNNNNLGNKLQGLLYAKVKEKRCQLMVTDMYMTVYDGERREDSNPVGTNPFVQSKEEYSYEHCTDPQALFDWKDPALPEDKSTIPPRRVYEPGQKVHYHYIGQQDAKATEGCTYSADIWTQWKDAQRDIAVTADADGVLQWGTTHSWTDVEDAKLVSDLAPAGVLTMVRYKQCNGQAKEKIEVLCNASWLVVPPPDEEG